MIPEAASLNIAPFIGQMEPEVFLGASSALFDEYRQLPSYGSDEATALVDNVLSSNLVELVLNNALDEVRTDVRGQKQAATAVEMLRGSGSTPERLYNLPVAVNCAASYHAVQRQLRFRSGTPMLSVFVNDYEIDPHCGITIQTAHSKGKPSWRHNPHRDEGGLPEIVVPARDLTSPTRSKSEERMAVLAARQGLLSFSGLNGANLEPAIVFDGRATVLTDQHEPKYLLPADERYAHEWEERIGDVGGEEYDYWLYDEFSINGRMPSGLHFVAVGDLAIQRLVARLQDEVLPYMSDSTPVGAPEAKRLTHLLTLASDAICLMNTPVTLHDPRSLKEDTWTSLVTELRETLRRRKVDIPANLDATDAPEWIRLCHETGELPNLNLEAVARRMLIGIRQTHEVKPVTADELLEAIRGEIQQSVDLARVLPEED